MINPISIATLGLHPGHTTFNCATLGYGFIQIIIEPSRGGSDLEVYDLNDSRKTVTVIVRFKGHEWKQSMLIETIMIEKTIQILTSISVVAKKAINVVASIKTAFKEIAVNVKRYK